MLAGILIGIWLLVVILICMFFKGVKITDTCLEHTEMIFKSPLDERTEFHPNFRCTNLKIGSEKEFQKWNKKRKKIMSEYIFGEANPFQKMKIKKTADKKRKSTRAASDTSGPLISGTRASKRSSKTESRSKSRKSK